MYPAWSEQSKYWKYDELYKTTAKDNEYRICRTGYFLLIDNKVEQLVETMKTMIAYQATERRCQVFNSAHLQKVLTVRI